jgi:hypothetical protein
MMIIAKPRTVVAKTTLKKPCGGALEDFAR